MPCHSFDVVLPVQVDKVVIIIIIIFGGGGGKGGFLKTLLCCSDGFNKRNTCKLDYAWEVDEA